MATYITLVKFTDKGGKDIKDTCKRAADYQSRLKKLNIEVKEIYWCMGAYDGAMIFEAADDETASAALLSLASAGNVHPLTLRAFTASEMTKILAKVP
jgi:uncharacterized protein with GYD domain